DRGEPAVEEVGAIGQRDVLPASESAGAEERLGVLIVFVLVGVALVVDDNRDDYLAGPQRGAVVDRDDADGVHVALGLGVERRQGLRDGGADDAYGLGAVGALHRPRLARRVGRRHREALAAAGAFHGH